MNKVEFLDNLDRLEAAKAKAKKEYDAFVTQLDIDERLLKRAYGDEHALVKTNEIISYEEVSETVVDTIYSVTTRIANLAEGPVVCFDYFRTNGGATSIDKSRIKKIPVAEQERIRKEAMDKALCKIGDDVLYYNAPYKVIGVYARSYHGEVYPVYRLRSKNNYTMFATTRDFRTGVCTVVKTKKEDCQGIAI